MDITGIRHQNLHLLLEELVSDGITKGLDQASALGITGKQPASYLSQLKSGKKMGDDVARKIERARGKNLGWMDHEHRATGPISSHETVREYSLPNRRKVQIEGAVAMDERGFWQRGDAETELWEVNTNDPLAYGVRLLTQHFEPVVSPGQCLLVSPAQEAKIGRWVLVTLIDERQSFRKLLGHDYGVWHFADVNRPASYLDLADDDVRRVERVMSVSWTD